MKRFLLFAGAQYYPGGGWGDFIEAFDSVSDAVQHIKPQVDRYILDWWHVIDGVTGMEVAEGKA